MLLRSRTQLHGAVLLFGGAGLFAKLIDLPAGSQVLGRTAIASIAVLVVSTISGQTLRPHRPADLGAFALLGALLAAHWFAFFTSVQVSTVSIAAFTMATFPMFTALIKPLVARRAPRTTDLALALLALVGVGLIVGSFSPGREDTQGVLWGIAAAVLFSVLAIVNESMLSDYATRTVAFYQYTVAAVLLAPFFAAGFGDADTGDWLLVLLLGTAFTALAHTLFIASMQRIRSEAASLAVSLEPLYAVLLAWLVLSEALTIRVAFGGALILVAVWFGSREPRSQSTTNVTAKPR